MMKSKNRKVGSSKLSTAALVLSASLLSSAAQAALVSIVSPDSDGDGSYTRFGDDYNVYQQDGGNGLADPSANGGEEFILLGAHETILHENESNANGCNPAQMNLPGGCTNEISVALINDSISVLEDNDAESNMMTGPISLVLTSSEDLVWNLSVDEGVDLGTIYLFGQQNPGLSLIVNDQLIVQDDVVQSSLPGLTVIAGLPRVCAISFPYDPNAADGCLTNNLLASLSGKQLTGFHAAYHVDSFDVLVTSTAVPVPAALWLFASALGSLLFKQRLQTARSER